MEVKGFPQECTITMEIVRGMFQLLCNLNESFRIEMLKASGTVSKTMASPLTTKLKQTGYYVSILLGNEYNFY